MTSASSQRAKKSHCTLASGERDERLHEQPLALDVEADVLRRAGFDDAAPRRRRCPREPVRPEARKPGERTGRPSGVSA